MASEIYSIICFKTVVRASPSSAFHRKKRQDKNRESSQGKGVAIMINNFLMNNFLISRKGN